MNLTAARPTAFVTPPTPTPEKLATAWIARRFRRSPATAKLLADLAQLGGSMREAR